MPRSALLNVMVQAAMKAGRGLTRDFGEVENLQVSRKGPGDFVSAADRRAEDTLRRELAKARPGYGFVLEEGGVVEGSDTSHTWIIDPLDGTTNFLHAIPHFAVSVGLEREGVLVAGVVYNPVTDELFTGERGQGAFFNDRRLRVAGRQHLADAVIVCGMPHMGRGDHNLFQREAARIMPRVAGIRRSGSAALDLAWTAAGRYDAFRENGLSPWDLAAGLVILREAGGTATTISGGEDIMGTGSILAANEAIHRELRPLLAEARAAAA